MQLRITDERANKYDAIAGRSIKDDASGWAAFIIESVADRTDMLAEIERLRAFEPIIDLPINPKDMTLRFAKGFLSQLVLAFDAINGDANYTATEIRTVENGHAYEVVVRRKDKPTDHELRKLAEAEIEKLTAARDMAIKALSDSGRSHGLEMGTLQSQLDESRREVERLRTAIRNFLKKRDVVSKLCKDHKDADALGVAMVDEVVAQEQLRAALEATNAKP